MNHTYALDVSSEKSPQSRWLTRLDAVAMPADLGQLIVDYVEGYAECAAATVLWNLDELPAGPDAESLARRELLGEVAVSGVPRYAPARQEVVFRLCDEPRPVLLLLTLQLHSDAEAFITALSPMLQLAGRRLRQVLKWIDYKHARLQLERSERLHRALFEISELAGSDRDLPEMLRCIHAAVHTLVSAENFCIVLYDEAAASLRYVYYVDVLDPETPGGGEPIPLDAVEHSLTWHLVTGGTAMMGSIAAMRDQVAGPLVVLGSPCTDWLGVPMLRAGRVCGAVVVQSYRQRDCYSAEDMALLKFVGSHIHAALERRQAKDTLEDQVRRRTAELAAANLALERQVEELRRAEHLQRALYQIARLATADIAQVEFYRQVHDVVGQFLNARNFFISLIDDDGQRLHYPYVVSEVGKSSAPHPIARTASGYVLEQGQPMMGDGHAIQALVDAGRIDPWDGEAIPTSWLAVPLVVDERAIGLIVVEGYGDGAAYTEADRDLLGFVAMQVAYSLDRRRSADSLQRRVEERTRDLCAEMLERERAQKQLSHQLMHDMLTGLPNRRCLRERIELMQGQLRREPQRRYALLYLDVDRFKSINDSLGHLAGDDVLLAVAERLSACLRPPDLAVRLSGDEFAVLLEAVDAPAMAMQVAQRIMHRFEAPMRIAHKDLRVSVSLGVVVCDARYETVDQVLHDADVALYRAKRMGRRRFELFDETMAKDAVDLLAMENDLRIALQHDQFEPYFQPIRRLHDGRVVGYEALIRWNHPERGILEPGQFLKVARDCKLLETIDWRMFELSFRAFAQHAEEHAYITFNVSALHLGYEDFDTRLIALLEASGLAPARALVEITEEVLLEKPEAVRLMLTRLRTLGVGTALDDFGTGYSSLHYLHTLPLHMLKIDRAFVNELDKPRETSSSTVVAAILALAQALNIQVIAEGIETPSQRDVLIAMGCSLGQGYLLGRPHPALRPPLPGMDRAAGDLAAAADLPWRPAGAGMGAARLPPPARSTSRLHGEGR